MEPGPAAGHRGTLKTRALWIVGATTIALIIALYVPLRFFILGSFLKLEDEVSLRDLERARNSLQDNLAALHATTRDYAVWDESYEFLAGERPDYPTVNFVDTTFIQNRLSLVAVADLSGRITYKKGFDLAAKTEVPAPEDDVIVRGARDVTLPRDMSGRDVFGILPTPGGPILLAAHPVLKSTREGPPRGTLIMGRALDAREVRRFADALRLDIGVRRLADAPASAELGPVATALAGERMTLARPISETRIAAYARLDDIRGAPYLLLRVEMPREVYARGIADIRVLGAAVVAAAIAFGCAVLVLLDRAVLGRVATLEAEVGLVRAKADHSLRVTVTGDDELARLGDALNAMLAALEDLNADLAEEREKAERLLLNILPKSIADRLKADEHASIADGFADVSVLFADIVGFTDLSARTTAPDLVGMLNDIFSRFDALAERHRLEKIKTIGDAYMVVGGLPEPRPDHARALVLMALDMQRALDEFNRAAGTSLRIRVGINSGPVVAGVIGTKKFIYDIWGDAVNTASRMESSGVPGRIQVSAATRERLGDEFAVEPRGKITVKGKGEMETFLVLGPRAPEGGPALAPAAAAAGANAPSP